MDGLQLPTLEPLCLSAFTCLSSLTVANRITQDSQVGAWWAGGTGRLRQLGWDGRTGRFLVGAHEVYLGLRAGGWAHESLD